MERTRVRSTDGLFVLGTMLSLLWVFPTKKLQTRICWGPRRSRTFPSLGIADPSLWRLVSARPWADTENSKILETTVLLFAVCETRSAVCFGPDIGGHCGGSRQESTLPTKDRGTSIRTVIRPSVCCLALTPGSPKRGRSSSPPTYPEWACPASDDPSVSAPKSPQDAGQQLHTGSPPVLRECRWRRHPLKIQQLLCLCLRMLCPCLPIKVFVELFVIA